MRQSRSQTRVIYSVILTRHFAEYYPYLFRLYVKAVAGKIGKFLPKIAFCFYGATMQQIYMYNWHINFSFTVVFVIIVIFSDS